MAPRARAAARPPPRAGRASAIASRHEPDPAELRPRLEVERVGVDDLHGRRRPVALPVQPVRPGAHAPPGPAALPRRARRAMLARRPLLPTSVSRVRRSLAAGRRVAAHERLALLVEAVRAGRTRRVATASASSAAIPAAPNSAAARARADADLAASAGRARSASARSTAGGHHAPDHHHEQRSALLARVGARRRTSRASSSEPYARCSAKATGRPAAGSAPTSPRGWASTHVEDDAGDRGGDPAAREREVERHRDDRQRRRRRDADGRGLALGRREVREQDRAEPAEDAHRVPVGERERQPLDVDARARRECRRQQARGERDRARDARSPVRPSAGARRRCPGARACRPMNASTSRYSSARSNSISARAGASDQPEDARIQAQNSASTPAVTASAALQPAKGRSASVSRATSRRHSSPAASPIVPAKNPPARNASATVRAAGKASCQFAAFSTNIRANLLPHFVVTYLKPRPGRTGLSGSTAPTDGSGRA